MLLLILCAYLVVSLCTTVSSQDKCLPSTYTKPAPAVNGADKAEGVTDTNTPATATTSTTA
jgi:hypothetical protein